MNHTHIFAAALVLLQVLAGPSFGASFRCKLVEVKTLRSDGLLDPHPLSDDFSDDIMIVDRETGTVFHPKFGNETYGERQVLDYGASESSFKVISLSPLSSSPSEGEAPFRNTVYLQIETFADGSNKPFIAVSGVAIGMGVCE
ncbi:hypothetical protein [Paracoccus marinaquae]|uniref:Uncharacterized protein n=1 Tax=Paracoccus marinaquae TaxID=2841926 RepID=A0ABS6AKX8_9RHOB|nr:hypothetical protein [Paracoccus marinaquae]MBU3030310.1 hypothetical protein [Paracoccus marinaquae]